MPTTIGRRPACWLQRDPPSTPTRSPPDGARRSPGAGRSAPISCAQRRCERRGLPPGRGCSGMLQAIGHILPIALAVAISSVPIMATIVILLSPKRESAAPFLVGWVLGMVLLVVICTLSTQAVPTPRSARQPDVAVGVGEMIVGAGLIVIAIVSWRRARRNPVEGMPAWLGKVESIGPWSAFGLGVALNIRPKEILLAIAAGLAVRGAGLSGSDAAIVIAVYTIIGASTVAVPVVATLIDAKGMQPKLLRMKEWLTRNSRVVTSLILLMVGVFIIGTGIGRL
ncbi:GAP family protein [Agromyces fucosus]|uniref:GAP family protein n=2 Tax=Agromyces fucosus TaxID=41985 RepID=A0A4Q2JSE2_9MICO|nr:GAP family protein [Agromyces fucosus]